jgi:pimeloyl-ACP methyl ester carboxylesterase
MAAPAGAATSTISVSSMTTSPTSRFISAREGQGRRAPWSPGSPTWRPNAGGWTDVARRRFATIASLDALGIHWFDGLAVVSYALTPELARWVTASYSYRLASNFGAGARHELWLKEIRRPAAILVGSADEQEYADQFAPLMQRLGLDIPVTIVPGMKHADMINHPDAAAAILRAMSRPQSDEAAYGVGGTTQCPASFSPLACGER